MKTMAFSMAFLALIVIAVVTVIHRDRCAERGYRTVELTRARQAVSRSLENLCLRLHQQLVGCAEAVATDRDFAMKLLVEQERNAPEVTEFSRAYLKAMGLSLLEIADSSWQVLSSGHFPASAGNIIAEKAVLAQGRKACFFIDQIRGEPHLTLQAAIPFSIAGVPLYCVGGWLVDREFIRSIVPWEGIEVLIRCGAVTATSDTISTISEVRDGSIVVNNRRRAVDTLALQGMGQCGGDDPVMMVLGSEILPCRLR